MRSLMIKFRRIRWRVHVACLAESKVLCKTAFVKPESRRHLEICTYKGDDIKMILRKYGVRM
jgi:hypothetical protein